MAWHARYFHPDRVILGLVGDFDSAEVRGLLSKVFGDWPRGSAVTEPPADYREQSESGVFYIPKNDINQSYIGMGHLGIQRDNPDYYAVEVMNRVLGRGWTSRLFVRIRSRQGLAYAVVGSVGFEYDYPGPFMMFMSTKVEKTQAGIEALLREARTLHTEPPTDEEVAKARASLLSSFVFRADSTSEILAQQLTYEYFGYPLDWLARFRAGIDRVTAAEVRAAAAKYIRPESFSILVVGPEEGAYEPLRRFGELQVVDITIPEPDAPAVELTAAGQEKAAQLIAKAVEGIGGAERLAAFRGLEITSTVTAQAPQGAMQLKTKATILLPDRMRIETRMPFGTMVQVLSGDQSFSQSPGGTQPLPESQRARLRAGLDRFLAVLLSKRDSEGFRATAKGPGEVNGRAVELVHVELDGEASTLGIEAETGRILSMEYRGQGLGGAPGELRQVFSDFREIDGLVLPYASETTFNGELMIGGTNDSIVVNPTIDESIFEKPQ